jgi:hypothetical protein
MKTGKGTWNLAAILCTAVISGGCSVPTPTEKQATAIEQYPRLSFKCKYARDKDGRSSLIYEVHNDGSRAALINESVPMVWRAVFRDRAGHQIGEWLGGSPLISSLPVRYVLLEPASHGRAVGLLRGEVPMNPEACSRDWPGCGSLVVTARVRVLEDVAGTSSPVDLVYSTSIEPTRASPGTAGGVARQVQTRSAQ